MKIQNSNYKKKILITGKKSFFGNMFYKIGKEKKYNILELDRYKKKDYNNVDCIVHFSFIKKIKNKKIKNFFNRNLNKTLKLIKLCKKKKIKLIFISTSNYIPGKKKSSENENLFSYNLYSMTKTLCEKYIKKNLTNYFILRISNLYGLKGSSILEKIINNIKKNFFLIPDDKNLIRDFINVNDACEIIFKVLNLKQKKLILNIGSGIPIKILDVYKFLKLKKIVKKMRFKKNHYTPQRKYFVSDTSKLKSFINYKLRYNVFNYLENELGNKI